MFFFQMIMIQMQKPFKIGLNDSIFFRYIMNSLEETTYSFNYFFLFYYYINISLYIFILLLIFLLFLKNLYNIIYTSIKYEMILNYEFIIIINYAIISLILCFFTINLISIFILLEIFTY